MTLLSLLARLALFVSLRLVTGLTHDGKAVCLAEHVGYKTREILVALKRAARNGVPYLYVLISEESTTGRALLARPLWRYLFSIPLGLMLDGVFHES